MGGRAGRSRFGEGVLLPPIKFEGNKLQIIQSAKGK